MVPRSLFGRLVLVLLGGLLAAGVVTMYINASERDRILYRAGGMQAVQRIVDVAKLLDSVAPAERRRIAALFDAPPLVVSLDRPPLAARDGDSDGEFRLAMLTSMLRYSLGDRVRAVVAGAASPVPPPAPPPVSPAMPMMGGMHGMPGMGPVVAHPADFVVQVGLTDGTLVTFDTSLSTADASIPRRVATNLAILLVTVVVLSLVAVRWVTRPLTTLAAAAESLGEDINRPPLAEGGPTEVRRAAKAFNTMQSRLARFINDRTRVLAAMSHDLKTPLTRIRLRAELIDDAQVRGKFLKDVEEMQSMIAQALDFMRDATSKEPSQPLDVMALLESMQDDYREAGHPFEVRGSAKDTYAGRPLALRRCLANLVDNAIRYGRAATVEVEERPGEIAIRVLDEGPGIPEADLERPFEPFFRVEASRSRETGGTGLGLGIARNIARAHGGDITLRNRPEGGLEATITLPRR
jgi:signal transduction histidine kinase